MALEPISNNGTFTGYQNLNFSLPTLSYTQNLGLNNTAATAKATGNDKVLNILNYVLTYGGAALDILSRVGIIKNKNAQTFSTDSFDLSAYQNALNSGQLNSAFSGLTPTTPTQSPTNSAKLFGLDFTNPFTWVGVLIFLFGVGYVIKQAKAEPETVKIRRK